jgi:hypothetical protein
MILYDICNLVLGSNIPLPELTRARLGQWECSFSLMAGPGPCLASVEWHQRWHSTDGGTWLALGKLGSGYILQFREIASFIVSADFREIRCFPQSGIPLDTIRHLLLDQVLALILSRRGSLVLHGSAVVAPTGAIAFLGATGQGKSTIAASFSAQGFPFLTDDCFVLKREEDRILAVPSYPGLRLRPESLLAMFPHIPDLPQVDGYSVKKRLGAAEHFPFHAELVAVKRIYLLSEVSSGISIEPVQPRVALPELMKYTFVMDINHQGDMRDKFEALGAVAARSLCYRLAFQRDFALLPDVRRAILAHVNT